MGVDRGMTMKKTFVKVAATAALLCVLAGVVALLTADGAGARNWGNITAVEESTPAGGPPSVTLHQPVPANPLKSPTLKRPYATVGPTAGQKVCDLKPCVEATP